MFLSTQLYWNQRWYRHSICLRYSVLRNDFEQRSLQAKLTEQWCMFETLVFCAICLYALQHLKNHFYILQQISLPFCQEANLLRLSILNKTICRSACRFLLVAVHLQFVFICSFQSLLFVCDYIYSFKCVSRYFTGCRLSTCSLCLSIVFS